jgi:two-component system NarL family sensor kinase
MLKSNEIVLAIIIVTLLISLLVGGIVIVFFISGRNRAKQQIQLAETKLNYERELRQVETEVSEQLLGQFAQELHDNIGQLLTAMHIQIENQKIDHPNLVEGFKPIEIYLDEVTQHLRLLSRTLNHDYIGHIGLFAAINLEVNRLNMLRRFDVKWQAISGPSNLSKSQELMVFRIFQEIVQNTLRHSAAKQLVIKINNQHGGFEMKVQDDGNGFLIEEVMASQKASGLRNIVKRAELAGFTCTIKSAPNQGCLHVLKKITTLE